MIYTIRRHGEMVGEVFVLGDTYLWRPTGGEWVPIDRRVLAAIQQY